MRQLFIRIFKISVTGGNIPTFLLLMSNILLWNMSKAQCSCPDSVMSKYRISAANAVLSYAEQRRDPSVLDSLVMSEDSINVVLDALCAVYKSTGQGRDSIFNSGAFFSSDYFDYYGPQLFNATGDTTVSSMKGWYKNGYTGIADADSFFARFTSKKKITYWGFINSYLGEITTKVLLNPIKTVKYLNAIMPGSSWGGFVNVDHSEWFMNRRGDSIILEFIYKWGDCQAGCIHKRSWHYIVSGNCNVSGPFYYSAPPVIPIQPIYVTGNPNQNLNLCHEIPVNYKVSFDLGNSELNSKTGGTYGDWFLNDSLVDPKQTYYIKDTGKYVLLHIPNDNNGVFVMDTFYVGYKKPIFNNKFFIQDTVVLCANEPFNWNDYLNNQAKIAMNSGKYYVKKPINPQAYYNYSSISLIIGESSTTCISTDSFWVVRKVKPVDPVIPDTVLLDFHDSLLLQCDKGWDSVFWDIGFQQQLGHNFKYIYADSTLRGSYPSLMTSKVDTVCYSSIPWTLILKPVNNSNSISGEVFETLKIYPNPASCVVHLGREIYGEFILRNMQGQSVQWGSIIGDKIEIVENLKGMYILGIKTQDLSYQAMVIFQ